MKIGIGVQGPSDREFWFKVLHKYFQHCKFDVRNLKSQNKLVRESAALLDTFRSAGYRAGFIILDRDATPCVTAVIDQFKDTIKSEARKPTHSRYLYVCVAIKELEAWYLADQKAINAVLPKVSYTAPQDTSTLNAKAKLKELWQRQHGSHSAFNKIELAKLMNSKFSPHEAKTRSASFSYFWKSLESVTKVA